MHSHLFFVVRCVALIGIALAAWPAAATSEPQRIYRCGNAYTNQPDPAMNCKPMAGGSVTVIEGTRVQGAQAVSAAANASGSTGAAKVEGADQRQRDAQAQVVLQSELQKAQQQHADLLREWNNGEPERRADEFRQPQKYQDRVAQLRAALQRTQADVAGLQRELARLGGNSVTPNGGKP
jgi:flagellar biosynthesis GTPase FlhF